MNRLQRGIILLMMLVGVSLASLSLAQEANQQARIIREIVFRGVERITPAAQKQMKDVIKSTVGQPFTTETADADVEAIRELGWFVRVSYRTEDVEGGVRLVFTVVEAPVISSIEFIGNTRIPSRDLLKVIKTRPGEVLNRDRVKPDALAIEAAYYDKGFTEVRVVDINIDDTNKLVFTIFEPRIGEIRIEGNSKTREYVIRRELTIKPGDVFNVNAVRMSLRNLDELGIFQEVVANPEPGTEPGTLMVAIHVKERRTGLAALGVGHSNIQGLIGFVDVADTNLFGSGQRLSFRVQFGADDSYQLSYTNPWIDTHKTSLTLNVYDRTILRQAVQTDQTFLYNEKRTGANLSIGRPIAPFIQGFLTFRNDKVRATADNNDQVPPILLQGSDIRSIALSGVRDTRNNFLNPSAGSYANLAVEYAGFGGADFTKFTGEGRRYWNLRPNKRKNMAAPAPDAKKKEPLPIVYATRFMLGTSSGAPPFLDQFLVGGADTLRGYKEDQFPGEAMLLWNNELRIPFSDALQAVLFVDAGDAWGGSFADQFGDSSFKLHVGYGAGIRVVTPIGPLRLDYGLNNAGGHEFHFGVGEVF